MSTSFDIHSQLLADCEQLGNLDLCSVLLMRDARFPWLILVPRINGLRDLHDLPANNREQALARAQEGGKNKGYEAAGAALQMLDLYARLTGN